MTYTCTYCGPKNKDDYEDGYWFMIIGPLWPRISPALSTYKSAWVAVNQFLMVTDRSGISAGLRRSSPRINCSYSVFSHKDRKRNECSGHR